MPSSLDELNEGERAVISEVTGTDSLSARLLEMGLLPGETIEMIGKAPMGDPIEYMVFHYRISLRKHEAKRVLVERE